MPALVWRTRPARSIRRCETICASAGFSFRVGRKYWLIRILGRSSLGVSGVAADCRKRGLQRQTDADRDSSPVIRGRWPVGPRGKATVEVPADSRSGILKIFFAAFPHRPLRGHLPRMTGEEGVGGAASFAQGNARTLDARTIGENTNARAAFQ